MNALRRRIIWLFALGYFAFYGPYTALIKLVTTGRVRGAMSGLELLPGVIVGTLLALAAFLTLADWWRYATRPSPAIIAAGIGTAAIIATTTIAYSFAGVTIVLALLLMRGGVLTLAPLVDTALGRHVRWFSWAALVLSIGAVILALSAVEHSGLGGAVALNLALYLGGYVVRLPAMTKVAKVEEKETTRRYFVTELLVAMAVLALIPLARVTRLTITVPALTIGVLYAGLYVFGTLIYLDRRENTFCIPLNRGASLLAGVVAMYVLAATTTLPRPPREQIVAASLILAALTLLSPLHHLFEVLADTAQRRARSI